MIFVGIDPGAKGGIAALEDRQIIFTSAMPVIGSGVDLQGLRKILLDLRMRGSVHVVLEEITQRIRMRARASKTFYRNAFAVEGLLAGLQIPYQTITPTAWTKKAHQGIDSRKNPKEKSKLAIRRLFPEFDCDHDGIIDAVLIGLSYNSSIPF